MSIRLIAKDLYGLQREVQELEKAIRNAPWEQQPELKDKLRKARAERDRMRDILEGQKDASKPYRTAG